MLHYVGPPEMGALETQKKKEVINTLFRVINMGTFETSIGSVSYGSSEISISCSVPSPITSSFGNLDVDVEKVKKSYYMISKADDNHV